MWPFNQLFPNPAKGAMQGLNQIPNTIKPYYDPYVKAGEWATPQLQQHFGQMLQDPNGIISKLGAGYQKSPGYDWRMQQGEQAINNANAAGGLLGTPQHQQQAGELAGHLADQDYQDYLKSVLGVYGMGAQGTQQLSQQGQQGASDLATSLAQSLMSQSNLRYAGQANQNQMTGGLIGNLLSLLGGK